MSSCSDYPTAQTAKTFKLDAETLNEVVTSTEQLTNPASDGNQKLTLKGIEAKYLMSALNGGVWAAGIEFTAYNQFMIYNGVSYKPKSTTALPYTSEATPNVSNVEPFSDINSGNIEGYTSNENIIPNSDFSIAGSVANTPDATPRSYAADDEIFQGIKAVGALSGVTYVNGKLNGIGQLYVDIYKTEKQKLSTANYAASIASSDGLPIESGASFVDSGDFWRVTFDMDDTFSVKLEQGNTPTKHEAVANAKELSNTLHLEKDIGWHTLAVNKASDLFAAIKTGKKIVGGSGVYIISDEPADSLNNNGETTNFLNFRWDMSGVTIKLADGSKTQAPFILQNMQSVILDNVKLNGNRSNVDGNNAGFFAMKNIANLTVNGLDVDELRRYAFSVIDDDAKPLRTNATFNKTTCDNCGVTAAGTPEANGQVILTQFINSLDIKGFVAKNTSGTGDGQLITSFFGGKITTDGIDILNSSPSNFYPSVSCVLNTNVTHNNPKVSGANRVAFEDNANINWIANNARTIGTNKALLISPNAGSQGNRRPQNITINNWTDTSTDALSFNIVGTFRPTLNNVNTNQDIGFFQDGTTNDKCQDVSIYKTTANNVTFSNVDGRRYMQTCIVNNDITNFGEGDLELQTVQRGAVLNQNGAKSFDIDFKTAPITIRETNIAAGSSITIDLDNNFALAPLEGFIQLTSWFTGSPSNQYSASKFNLYNRTTSSVTANQIVEGSGTTPRSLLTVTTLRNTVDGTATITIKNDDSVEYGVTGLIFITP